MRKLNEAISELEERPEEMVSYICGRAEQKKLNK
jgi:hypothetical protein